MVEYDDSYDGEERRIAHFLSGGCTCKLHGGRPCHTPFSASQLRAMRDEYRQLTCDELDMVVMGQLRALCQSDPTQKTKAKNTEPRRTMMLCRFGGHRICLETFCFLHMMSHKRFESLKAWWLENGLCPRMRATVAPHNVTRLSDVKKWAVSTDESYSSSSQRHEAVRHQAVHLTVFRRSRHPSSRVNTWLQTRRSAATAIIHYWGVGTVPPGSLSKHRHKGCVLLSPALYGNS